MGKKKKKNSEDPSSARPQPCLLGHRSVSCPEALLASRPSVGGPMRVGGASLGRRLLEVSQSKDHLEGRKSVKKRRKCFQASNHGQTVEASP